MYADDTVLYFSGKSCQEIESHLNADLGNLAHWFDNNYLTLNTYCLAAIVNFKVAKASSFL